MIKRIDDFLLSDAGVAIISVVNFCGMLFFAALDDLLFTVLFGMATIFGVFLLTR